MDDKPAENAAADMSDPQIPAVDVEMVVGETPIQFNDGPAPSSMQTYTDEMRQSGLLGSDIKCFKRAYKNLEDIKYVKSHCTSCDKHLGSAPNQRAARYEHPLLRVVVCQQCFEFYGSGDFEKDEDGSEMYCRWCGEGGDVFCCTKCPYVFCKKCIQQNLGPGTARSIQNSLHWWCFVCNPDAICRLRVACWALKKWSAQMLQKAEVESTIDVSTDANVCCLRSRKPSTAAGAKSPAKRKSRSRKRPAANAKKPFAWPHGAQHEVICTPDIIPVDDSPSSSPKPEPTLPTLVPKLQFVPPPPPLRTMAPRPLPPPLRTMVPAAVRPTLAPVPPPPLRAMVPPTARPPIQTMAELQKQLAAAYPQKIFITQASPLAAKPVLLKPATAAAAASGAPRSKLVSLGGGDSKYKLLITNPVANRTNYLLAQLTAAAPPAAAAPANIPAPAPPPPAAAKPLDWFEQSLVHCTEVTDFITSKVASLRGAHARATSSATLMAELHYTMQTFLFAAVEKLRGIKQLMYSDFVAQHGDRLVNPCSRAQKRKLLECGGSSSDSEPYGPPPPRWKRRRAARRTREPDDVPLDMVVTCESDERSPAGDEVELVGEIQTRGVSNEVISLLESSDEEAEEDAPVTNGVSGAEHPPPVGEVATSNKAEQPGTSKEPADDTQVSGAGAVDIEDMITSAVLPNSNSKSFKRFADAFSMFIGTPAPQPPVDASANTMLELMGSDVDYMDNGSLSVPPGDLTECVRRSRPASADDGDVSSSSRSAKGKGKGKLAKTRQSAAGEGGLVTLEPAPGSPETNTLRAEC